MSQEADCSFWNTVPNYFLKDDRSNPARAAAAQVIAKEVRDGAKTLVEIGPCLGFDYADHFRSIKGLCYVGYEGAVVRVADLKKQYGKKLFEHKTFGHLRPCSFDIVYTKATLEHQPNFKYGLEQMLRAARRLVLINWYRPPADEPLTEFHDDIQLHFNTYRRTDVENTIKKAGWCCLRSTVDGSTNELYELRPML